MPSKVYNWGCGLISVSLLITKQLQLLIKKSNRLESEGKRVRRKKKWKEYKKGTIPVYITPTSVQETIPIYQVSKNGIFQLENQKGLNTFDKGYEFGEINYGLKDDMERAVCLERYCELLNSQNTPFKICVINQEKPENEKRDEYYVKSLHQGKIYDFATQAMNKEIGENMDKGNNNLVQKKYFIPSCKKTSMEEAKGFFNSLEKTLVGGFDDMGSTFTSLEGLERLRVLHQIYRPGEVDSFDWTWDDLKKVRRDWRNDICNTKLKENSDYIDFGNQLGTVLFARKLPKSLSDEFFNSLTSEITFPSVTTISVNPVPQDVSKEKALTILDNVERSIMRQQDIRNKARMYSSDISRVKRKEKERFENDLDEIDDNDQRYFFTGLSVFIPAPDKETLDRRVEHIQQIGERYSVDFAFYIDHQMPAFQSILPLAVQQVNNNLRPLFANSLAAFVPFNVQEVVDKGGFHHGINQVTKRIILINRKKLNNGNGFVYGPSGGGKSMDVKLEMEQILTLTNDDLLVLDPSDEYIDICELYGGQVIKFAVGSGIYYNSLEIPEEVFRTPSLRPAFIGEKADFMMSLFRDVMERQISGLEKSFIDQTVHLMYEDVFAEVDQRGAEVSPTFKEFKVWLDKLDNPVVEDLSTSFKLYVDGSLDMFAHPSNVDVTNRFVVFAIRDVGKALKKPAMKIIMEIMRSRLKYNSANRKTTNIYGDELHTVFDDDESTESWAKLWRIVRKDGGFATGILQNTTDSTLSPAAQTMVANSEYMVILSLKPIQLPSLHSIVNLSNREVKYITEKPKGTGILKVGSKIIAFDHRISKENPRYWLYTTNPEEKAQKDTFIKELREWIQKEEEPQKVQIPKAVYESLDTTEGVSAGATKAETQMPKEKLKDQDAIERLEIEEEKAKGSETQIKNHESDNDKQNQEESIIIEDFAGIEDEIEDDFDILDQTVSNDELLELIDSARSSAEDSIDKPQLEKTVSSQKSDKQGIDPIIKKSFDAFSELMQTVKDIS